MPHEFTCARCKVTFHSQWTEEEALAEMREVFGDVEPSDQASLCDECYERFKAWCRSQGIIE